MHLPKVLYIEDKLEWQENVRIGLGTFFDITIAKNEKSARDLLKEDRFDLILLDLVLDSHPKEGLNLWEYIRKEYQYTPVVIVTGLEEGKLNDILRNEDPPYCLKERFDAKTWADYFNKVIKEKSTQLFISHSSKDKPFAYFIKLLLEEKGIKVWLDKEELNGGGTFIVDISEALFQMDYVLVILSPAAVKSKNVEHEAAMAVSLENDGKLKRVIPLIYKKCEVPKYLYLRNQIKFHELLEDFDKQLGL